MKTLPAILEEEGKLLKEQFGLYSNYADFCPSVESYIGFLLASHKRVLGEVVKMVEAYTTPIDKLDPPLTDERYSQDAMNFMAKNLVQSLKEGITDTKR